MELVDLKKQYPGIVKVCRERDCSFSEAITFFKAEQKKGTLLQYGGG